MPRTLLPTTTDGDPRRRRIHESDVRRHHRIPNGLREGIFFTGLLIGLMLLLFFGAACGARSPYGTSLHVTVSFPESAKLTQLRFRGLTGESPAFPTTLRPEAASATTLASPQAVRALLSDALAGTPVRVRVEGLDGTGAVVLAGEATSPSLVRGDEVAMTVTLGTDALDGGGWPSGTGGGTGSDGGSGAGTGGGTGGAPDAGPAAYCDCATTCCSAANLCIAAVPLAVSATRTVSLVGCGQEDQPCSFACDPLKTSQCIGRQCLCGNVVCGPGQRCASDGAGGVACVCDRESNCHGCCDGATCVQIQAGTTTCGTGGSQCHACGAGKVCGADGTCTGTTCDAGACRTADGCELPAFPTCVSSGNCTACDPVRSDRCGQPGACRCGANAACVSTQYCDQTGATPTCKPLWP